MFFSEISSSSARYFPQFILEDACTVEYNQPGVPCLDRDNIGIVARFRVRVEEDRERGGAESLSRQRDRQKRGVGRRRRKRPSRFVVANTHLLYNPNRQDIKLSQSMLLLAGKIGVRPRSEENLSRSHDSISSDRVGPPGNSV